MPALGRRSVLLVALLLFAAPAAAQPSDDEAGSESEVCETDLAAPVFSEEATGEAAGGATATPAEERVRQILSEKGVHVVRLWAPWCSNSTGEMRKGWDRLITDNEDVSFTFVTVWNNGDGGASTLARYGLSTDRLTEVVPADPEQGRLDRFMGYALDWVPSTWIFRSDGEGTVERAFALNYGEMERSTLQTLLDAARAEW